MRILITGPVGSGKTVQGEILSKELNIPLIDTGSILRELAEGDSKESEVVRKVLEQGGLVPDEIAGKLVRDRVEREDCQEGFVMDGYPRRLSQLKSFDPKFDQVFYLDVNDGEVL